MRDHGPVRDGESGDLGHPVLPGVAADAVLDTPNCPDCLTRMEAEESPKGEPYWACTECGFVALA